MTAKYFAILTNYGAAQLANAVALGTQMNISAMAVGDGGGTLPVPDPAQTKLVRENRRAAVNQVSVDEKNPNFIIAEQVIPENEGGWWIREIGLFDDNGGLIAVGNAPETYKPNLQEGSGRTQVIQMVLMVSSTQAITLKVDPSVVLATREYVTKSIDAAIQASEARAAQTYQPKGDYVTNQYLKLELIKKIDKADITQQLGNDTGKVVSQNLLTTELGKKASVADANSKLAKDQNGADIQDKPKFIENLGLG
ncbi:phage tail protein, partial [Morganella sp. B601]|uniref:phage tail protein n=1 Tax=Morganella sp. B601 TaxID=3444315 RepID=UPI003EB9A0E4